MDVIEARSAEVIQKVDVIFLARLDSSAETRTRERSAYAAFPFAIFIGGF